MVLKTALKRFIYALDGEVQPATLDWYNSHLTTLLNELGDTDITNITIDDLRAWRHQQFHQHTRYATHPHRREKPGGISIYTKRGRIRALKRFFGWLCEETYITTNPAQRIKAPPKPSNREPKAVSEEDILKLYHAARNLPRELALLHILDETGARVGGIANLKLGNISRNKRTLIVTEKGGKTRPVYLTEDGGIALQSWLNIRPNVDNNAVFITERTGTPLSTCGIYQALKRLAKTANVKRFNPHSFRHAFAREMLNSGASLDTVSDLLGHSGITVTAENYAIWTKDEIKNKHHKFSQIRQTRRAKNKT